MVDNIVFILQFDGSSFFAINLPRRGFVTVAKQLDFESLKFAGQTYYELNISATVSISM